MPDPIPGALIEWVETSPTRWERTGHPEDGVICVTPPTTFPEYYAIRALPTREEVFAALPAVVALRAIFASATDAEIESWMDDNANSLPEIRTFLRTLIKLMIAT